MPKNKVKTIPVNKKVFLFILNLKKSSIRKLGKEIEFSEKTIRRALNNGEMRPKLVKEIAKHLNIDSTLLTGELIKDAFKEKNRELRLLCLDPLGHIDDYPYFREEQRDLETEGFNETMKRVLSLFDVSYSQYENLKPETQYNFEHDLYYAMLPIIKKYFKKNAYDKGDATAFVRSIYELELWKEHDDELKYADTVIRQKYLENPPKGLTKSEIENMTSEEILNYDIDLQLEESYDPEYVNPIRETYIKQQNTYDENTEE